MLVKEVRGHKPQFGANFWAAENATVVGECIFGKDCTVWFGAVVRGDVNGIKFGDNCNIQDNATVHCTFEQTSVNIGNNVSIAHNAVVHGCTIEDNVMVGMGAILMDNVYVETNAIIAAGAVVLEGTRVESGHIYAGVPAKKLKKADPASLAHLNQRVAKNYTKYASWFKED